MDLSVPVPPGFCGALVGPIAILNVPSLNAKAHVAPAKVIVHTVASCCIWRAIPMVMQCAPTARITSGGRFHPESCR
jgi:hypothetical protein